MLFTQNATNMQHDFVFYAAKTKNFASPNYSTSGSVNLTWKVEVELFFFYEMLHVTFIPCVVCLTSPSRQAALNF